jgi:hypothetical protein
LFFIWLHTLNPTTSLTNRFGNRSYSSFDLFLSSLLPLASTNRSISVARPFLSRVFVTHSRTQTSPLTIQRDTLRVSTALRGVAFTVEDRVFVSETPNGQNSYLSMEFHPVLGYSVLSLLHLSVPDGSATTHPSRRFTVSRFKRTSIPLPVVTVCDVYHLRLFDPLSSFQYRFHPL